MTIRQIHISLLLLFSMTVSAQNDICICCTENHKAFDFWEGKWEVKNSEGINVGSNTIEKTQDNCILMENWIGSSGSTGMSLNFYNLETKQWEQLWVDNAGTHLKLKGNRVGNRMILSSDKFTDTDGEKYVNRITWTLNNDGTVKQLWEVLQNEKVVRVAFDGLYRKIK